MRSALLVTALFFACSSSAPRAPDAAPQASTSPSASPVAPGPVRTPAVASDHPLYGRVEGTSFKNTCAADADCKTGGCSTEVCSAEEGVNSTCELPVEGFPGKGTACGCVSGACIWYVGEGAPVPTAAQCGDATCAAGQTCVSYYGIAGPRGPKFTSCERTCGEGDPECPAGESCITIADGPGQVCRAARKN